MVEHGQEQALMLVAARAPPAATICRAADTPGFDYFFISFRRLLYARKMQTLERAAKTTYNARRQCAAA